MAEKIEKFAKDGEAARETVKEETSVKQGVPQEQKADPEEERAKSLVSEMLAVLRSRCDLGPESSLAQLGDGLAKLTDAERNRIISHFAKEYIAKTEMLYFKALQQPKKYWQTIHFIDKTLEKGRVKELIEEAIQQVSPFIKVEQWEETIKRLQKAITNINFSFQHDIAFMTNGGRNPLSKEMEEKAEKMLDRHIQKEITAGNILLDYELEGVLYGLDIPSAAKEVWERCLKRKKHV
jgi:hypothetical protein